MKTMHQINAEFAKSVFNKALNEIENPSTEVTEGISEDHQKFYNMLEKYPPLYKVACENVFRVIKGGRKHHRVIVEGTTTIEGKITIE